MDTDLSPTAERVQVRPAARGPFRLLWRTITKAWDDSIFGMAAQAAFWQTLSLPPLLLGLLGSIGYVSGWFGPDTINIVQ
ncbi:MAG: YihY/virulence factor BrkB family protein, partial [Mycobacteriaceae bacterium]